MRQLPYITALGRKCLYQQFRVVRSLITMYSEWTTLNSLQSDAYNTHVYDFIVIYPTKYSVELCIFKGVNSRQHSILLYTTSHLFCLCIANFVYTNTHLTCMSV